MEFIKALEEVSRSHNFREFNQLPIPGNDSYNLSIQASYAHRCTPQKTLPIEEYTTMEFAIVGHGMMCNVNGFIYDDDLYIKLDKFFNGSAYEYVPIELIEDLYKELFEED